MGLIFTGVEVATESGRNLQARDQATQNSVVVRVSSEAIEDHGVEDAKRVAARKYDAGQIEDDGGVSVRTADF